MGGGQTAPTIIRMAAPVGGAGGGQILRTIGGQQVVRVRAPAPTLASGQQIKVVGSSGQIIKSTTVSAAQAAQGKVETILKGSLDSIPSPSPKVQIMGGKVCLRCKGKTLLGIVNKLLITKKHPAIFCTHCLKLTFPPII